MRYKTEMWFKSIKRLKCLIINIDRIALPTFEEGLGFTACDLQRGVVLLHKDLQHELAISNAKCCKNSSLK